MEYEIDLGRYLRVLGRKWYWTLIAAACCALGMGAVSAILPTSYTATTTIFFRPIRSQVQLDERFITNETSDISSQRTTLLTLAQSPSIGALLSAQSLSQLGLTGKSASEIADLIDVSASGDLINILASGATPKQASSLADAWAEAFVANVNQLYSQTSPPASNDQVEAQYDAAQTAFEQFTGSNRISELDQRIAATKSVLTASLEAEQTRYETYLTRTNQLDLMLRDAETLRQQLAGSKSISLADNIALLTLRSRISSGTEPGVANSSPVQLQITLPTAIERGEGITLQDLDLLIGTLHTEIDDTRAAAMKMAGGLVTEGPTSESSLTDQNRVAYYEQLSALEKQREAEEGRRLVLQQERDVALDALKVARSKAAEQQVAAVQPDVEVRMVGTAMLPDAPTGPNAIALIATGAGFGVLLAILLIILVELSSSIKRLAPRNPHDRGPSLSSTAEQT